MVAILWGVVALVFTAQGITSAVMQGRAVSWQWDVVHELIYFTLWGLCTPIIVWAARRFWIEPGSGPGPWLAHLGTAVVLAPLQLGATYLVHGLGLVVLSTISLASLPGWLAGRGRSVLLLSFTGVLYYWVVLGVYYAAAYRRLYLIQRAEATEATLDALRAQLQPHFLFNTLNSVSVLAEENPPAAGRVLLRLSELLRTVLRRDARHEAPLEEEEALLGNYLEIQRVRFEERLDVAVAIDPTVRQALVPWLVLQPLVENAIRYAVEPRAAGGRIRVTGERVTGDRLRLTVEDDGPGPKGTGEGEGSNGLGLGLANTRARLARLYGDRQTFRLATAPAGGCRVVIEIPYREAP